jgi:hypothetical protein
VSYAKKSVNEKKKISAALNCANSRKIGDRRIALCALAISAGQPTERLATVLL